MSENGGQSRFTEDRYHLSLKPSLGVRQPKAKPRRRARTKDAKPRFLRKSKASWNVLRRQSDEVLIRSKQRETVYPDARVYFKIRFSDDFTWEPIREAMESLRTMPVKQIDEKTWKLAVRKSEYVEFLGRLHRVMGLVEEIGETTQLEKAGLELSSFLADRPNDMVDVTMQFFDISGLDSEALWGTVHSYLERNGAGEASLLYGAEKWALLEAKAAARTVVSLADAIGFTEKVELMPQIALVSDMYSSRRDDVELASIISLTKPKDALPTRLPFVCALDSGVNREHELTKYYIGETYDFGTGSPGPCLDEDGHGSMVSGILVYGGNLENHRRPVVRVVMVKGFRAKYAPLKNPIEMVRRMVEMFGNKARVFNLSFGAFGPNLSITQALNEIAYRNNVVVVASSGNVNPQDIMSYLNVGDEYPGYLFHHQIYFPGDADNAITVGSYSAKSSNRFRGLSPSPFNPTGFDSMRIKPDVLEEGGNLNTVQKGSSVVGLNYESVAIVSTGRESPQAIAHGVGTSFAAPTVAALASRVIDKYPDVSPFLVKALIISSCKSLVQSGGTRFDPFLQGYGVPDEHDALSSSDWRACYLLQGEFQTANPNLYHEYDFFVADKADRITVTFVVGKPSWSTGWFSTRLYKSGVMSSLAPKPEDSERVGDAETKKHINSTYREVYRLRHGGKGIWKIRIVPHFEKQPGIDASLRYGCVITVESTRSLGVYEQIAYWLVRPIAVRPSAA